MKIKKSIMIICITACILFSLTGVFANDAANETVGAGDFDAQQLQVNNAEVNDTLLADDLSTSVVYFDASAASDGDGSQSKPYKYYKADRINYGGTVYFANGVYDISESTSIYSSSTYKTTFIGQSIDKTILKSSLDYKFDFTVTDNSYFVLKDLTMVGVHINNQANLIASNVDFRDSEGFIPGYPPSLSYASEAYDSSYGGVIICDTPNNKRTTIDLTGCYFNNNAASSGGVIAAYNTIVNINNCFFYNSTATRFGGAIYSLKSSVTISGSTFRVNNAKYGGAIFADSSDFNLKDSQFSQSQSYSFGGVIASFSSKITINNVNFDNYASLNDAGGAIYSIGATLKVADSSFKDGYSDFGGAICNLNSNSTISNSNFINNYARYYGGTIYDMYGRVTLSGNTFDTTNAKSGGTIFNRLSDSFTLSNNKFTNSTADEGPIVFIDGSKVSIVQSGNVYDNSKVFLKYGNLYEIDYYKSVPLIHYSVESVDFIPSSYDSRKYGYITPAKDQIQGGNCWAFSGIATLEACIKKATGIEYDFSEENVKNLMAEYSLFDSYSGANTGGNLNMFIAYLAGWFGPTYDYLDAYDDYSSLSVIYDSLVHVQNVYILPERESFYDNNYIKKAVMEYGAVSIGIDLSEGEDHAVTIVGWDDEFVSNDFLGNKAVGAWIIKNSWGTQWGYDGFGYLSYQQPINFGYTFILGDEGNYDNIYQYDFAGKRGLYSISSDQVYLKNVFTAKNDEILSAFSTYFDEPTNYTASIYLNGKLMTTQNGYATLGYYTIPLEKEVSLKKGDTFEVVIKIFNGAPVYMPVCPANINKMNFGKGISFYSTDGKNWVDLYESNDVILCIKAFTRANDLTKIQIDETQFSGSDNPLGEIYVGDLVNIPLKLPATYVDGGVQYALDGMVTFKINDEYYFATVENGNACLNITFDKKGVYDVTVQYESSRVVSNPVNFKVTVSGNDQSNIVIKADDVSKFYGGSEKYIATVYNADKPLSGVNVKITVNGKDYTVKTDSNGQAILNLDLPVGIYDISAEYGGKRASSKFTVLTTIGVNNITSDFLNSYASASFLNTDGSFLSDTEVTFSVKFYGVNSVPVERTAKTNIIGVATAKINLGVDKYSVSVVNPINNEKQEFTLDISKIDSQCILSVSQPSDSSVIINANINPVQSKGYVNFLVSGKVYKVNVSNSLVDGSTVATASLQLDNLAPGDYSVSAFYSGDDNVRISSDTIGFSVNKNPHKLASSNYYSFYGYSGTMVKLYDVDKTDSSKIIPVKGEVVSATILNKTYKSTTDEDGDAVFRDLNLDVGNYTVLFEYKGQSLLKRVYVYSTIDYVTPTGQYLNSKLGAYFTHPTDTDENGNDKKDSGITVKFIVNGKEYSAVTDSNGYASVDVDLPVGTHPVTIISPRGEKKQTEITIYKTTPKVSITSEKHGDAIFFTATITEASAVGNVIFTMGSNKYTTEIIGGSAMLAFNSLEEGSYEIYANYIGDANFNNILSQTFKFNYAHTDYNLVAPKVSKYYGGPEKLTATLTNYNNPVPGETVRFVIGDKVYDIKTDSKGVASFAAELNPGLYSVRCTFDEEIVSSEITVKSTITVKDSIADVSYSRLTAEFIDGNGNLIKNREVTFKVDSNEYKQTTDNFGVATLNAALNKGSYNVTITNPVTGEIKYSTLIIEKSAPSLTLSFTKQNGIDVLKAVLPKDATGEVAFVFNNGDEYSSEVHDGVAILDGFDEGKYTVTATFEGDNQYGPVSKSISFSVNSITSALIASKVTTTYGTAKNLVVSLVNSKGDMLVGRQITVNLNSKNYNAVVQGDGNAVIKVPSSLAAKTYTATVTYRGETGISGSTLKVSVVVNKAAPKLTAAKKTFKVKDKTKKYVVTLKTNKNKVYKNQKITIKVNGKTYTAKTNSKGQATFKLTKLTKKGTFTATVKYSGSANFKALTKKVKMTVK